MANQETPVEVTTIAPVIVPTMPVTEAVIQPEGTVINIEAEPTYLELTAIQEVLSKSNLPQIAKDKLAKGRYQTVSEVDAVVKGETEYLKEIRGSGRPFGQGVSTPVEQHPQTIADYDTRISEIISKYTNK